MNNYIPKLPKWEEMNNFLETYSLQVNNKKKKILTDQLTTS